MGFFNSELHFFQPNLILSNCNCCYCKGLSLRPKLDSNLNCWWPFIADYEVIKLYLNNNYNINI